MGSDVWEESLGGGGKGAALGHFEEMMGFSVVFFCLISRPF